MMAEPRSPEGLRGSALAQRLLCLVFGILVVTCLHLDLNPQQSAAGLNAAHNSGALAARLGYK